MTEERLQRRLAELRAVLADEELRIRVIRTIIAELEALLQPETTGDALGEQTP